MNDQTIAQLHKALPVVQGFLKGAFPRYEAKIEDEAIVIADLYYLYPSDTESWGLMLVYMTGGTYNDPPDAVEKELGEYSSLNGALLKIAEIEAQALLDGIAESLLLDEQMQEEKKYASYLAEPPIQDEQCPHGRDFAECEACMRASDFAYDAAREQRHFR